MHLIIKPTRITKKITECFSTLNNPLVYLKDDKNFVCVCPCKKRIYKGFPVTQKLFTFNTLENANKRL